MRVRPHPAHFVRRTGDPAAGLWRRSTENAAFAARSMTRTPPAQTGPIRRRTGPAPARRLPRIGATGSCFRYVRCGRERWDGPRQRRSRHAGPSPRSPLHAARQLLAQGIDPIDKRRGATRKQRRWRRRQRRRSRTWPANTSPPTRRDGVRRGIPNNGAARSRCTPFRTSARWRSARSTPTPCCASSNRSGTSSRKPPPRIQLPHRACSSAIRLRCAA